MEATEKWVIYVVPLLHLYMFIKSFHRLDPVLE